MARALRGSSKREKLPLQDPRKTVYSSEEKASIFEEFLQRVYESNVGKNRDDDLAKEVVETYEKLLHLWSERYPRKATVEEFQEVIKGRAN